MHDYICGKLPNSFHGNYPMNRDIQQTHQTRQSGLLYVIVKERHETIMGYKPRERVALEWFIPIIVELLVL